MCVCVCSWVGLGPRLCFYNGFQSRGDAMCLGYAMCFMFYVCLCKIFMYVSPMLSKKAIFSCERQINTYLLHTGLG